MQTISKTVMCIVLLSLIGQGMASILIACDMHHDEKPEMHNIDHSTMAHHEMPHHEMSHHLGHEQSPSDEMQHDCCSDEASCVMSSCVTTSYLVDNLALMTIHTSSGFFIEQIQQQPKSAIPSLYRPPILA